MNATAHINWRRLIAGLFKVIIPLGVSVGLCYLLFAKQNIGELVDIARANCDFRWIAGMLVLNVLALLVRALRWRIQLRAIGVTPSLWTLLLSFFGTYAVNLVAPRLGELWRTGYISERQDAPFDTIFGSMVSDRLADTIAVGLLTLATFFVAGPKMLALLEQNAEAYHHIVGLLSSPWLWTALAVMAIAIWAVLRGMGGNSMVKRVRSFCRGVWDGFAALAHMNGKVAWLLLTVALWSCYYFGLVLAFMSFPATAELVANHGLTAVMVCFVFSSVSMAVPSQGGIGPWQWALMFGISLYSAGIPGLTEAYAASFANLVMGVQTLMFILLGLLTFAYIAFTKRNTNDV